MGQEIVYCFGCQTRLLAADFERGDAVRFEDRVACAACAREHADSLPAPDRPPPPTTKTPRRGTSRRLASPTPRTGTRTLPDRAGPGGSRMGLAIGAGAVLLGIILVATLSSGGGGRNAPPPPDRTVSKPAPAPDPEPPPTPPLPPPRPTPPPGPDFDAQAAEVKEQTRPLAAEERFGAALDVLHAARGRHGEDAWTARIDRLTEELEGRIDALYADAERSAEEARRRDDADAEKIARDRVAKWGIRELEGRLEAHLASIRPTLDGVVTEGLVGYWKLDEGRGDTVKDLVDPAQTGRLKGNPAWTQGVLGGALRFDGVDDHVELPSTPALNRLHLKDYSIAAWFKPEDMPPGTDDANDAAYGVMIKAGRHVGVCYVHGRRFLMEHWITGGHPLAGTWSREYPPGKFYHLVGTVDFKAGRTLLYVNGRRAASKSWKTPGAPGLDLGRGPWRIGAASPGAKTWAWPAKGVIDDVRAYDRVLTAAEAAELYEAGRKR